MSEQKEKEQKIALRGGSNPPSSFACDVLLAI